MPRMRPKGRGGAGRKKKERARSRRRFNDRGGKDWEGPLIDYKEVDLLRKMMTTSHKIMSRKRAGTNAAEQRALKEAIKRARYIGLLQYTGP